MNQLVEQVKSIISKEYPLVSNLANCSSILFYGIKGTSWAGFYLSDKENKNLFLHAFQGPVACIKIPFGKGVCGTSALEKRTVLVDNVLEFKGHIACSSLSRSEVVVPIIKDNIVYGVIDLDSNDYNNFTQEDVQAIEMIASLLSELF